MKFKILILFVSLLTTAAVAQNTPPENWFNLDPKMDAVPGMSTEKAYKDLIKGKGQTVIVAIIDSGVDAEHEDLADIMWVNEDEVAGNGIDDDKNGYIDDVHGWNFIGGKDGRNVNNENLEVVRIYNRYKKEFEGKDASKLSKKDKVKYATYKEYEKVITEKQEKSGPQLAQMKTIGEALATLQKAIGKDAKDITLTDFESLKVEDPMATQIAAQMPQILANSTFKEALGEIDGAIEYFSGQVEYNYNPDFDARDIVGDNIEDKTESNYGNNDVEGPDAGHGTHVSGIVAAIRDNNLGIKGVANNVRIMSVRTVPNGDERDKDVANAIRYAVDNGASVINMSFGKGASPYKKVVDDAVRYARKHDVLLVHAAGNDGKKLDGYNNYPTDRYQKRKLFRPKYANNWIEVGALAPHVDAGMTASFSNYSSMYVDVFAPGAQIKSSTPNNEYSVYGGTSMAAPMVAGLAALLRSQYPSLTAEQVKQIIMESAVPQTILVNLPGDKEKQVAFSTLCATGAIANTYTALQLAAKTKGKKK